MHSFFLRGVRERREFTPSKWNFEALNHSGLHSNYYRDVSKCWRNKEVVFCVYLTDAGDGSDLALQRISQRRSG